MHVYVSDTSDRLSSLFGSPVRNIAPLAGKSGVSDVTDTFSGVFKLLAMLCMRARMFDTSDWLSSLSRSHLCGSAPLAGKSSIIDVFCRSIRIVPNMMDVCMCSLHACMGLKSVRFATLHSQ